jgi:molybdate transport system substrate-binding protein
VRLIVAVWLTVLLASQSFAGESINVAVTASFKPVIEELTPIFESTYGVELRVSAASTGVLYQQIISGAPFDVFFAADSERPEQLIQTLNLNEARKKTYAFGSLVLVTNSENVRSLNDLMNYQGRIIIANPAHAPYGIAAVEVLQTYPTKADLVMANNVTQARQYLSLQLAPVGLIAASVAKGFDNVIEIDRRLHTSIEQQLVILNDSANVSAFVEFLSSREVESIILDNGYQLPNSK